ncbi:MAG: MMPL family transporter [Alphaproteobacteria bacterium]|nr:MMPL family transporter [Alphaproteobacteria bacterium]
MRLRALLLCVLVALAALASSRVTFDSGLEQLVPATGDIRRALATLRDFPASDVLVLIVDGGEHPERLPSEVTTLAETLRALPHVRRVDAGFDLAQGAIIGERLADHAAAFVPADDLRARTSPDGIRQALLLQRERLMGPAGGFLEGRILRDPLDLESLAIAKTTAGLAGGVTLRNGLLTSPDGRYAMVLVQPAPRQHVGVDDPLIDELRPVVEGAPLPVLWYGGARFGWEAATGIRDDVTFAAAASTVVLVIVLVLGFRTWRTLVGTVPAVLVAGAGAAFGAWALSPIHPVQLGFSGALAGIAADYWVHLYLGVSGKPGQVDVHTRYAAALEEVAELWPTLLLNAGATSLAFVVLMLSDVPALRVLGVTGALAAICAFVATTLIGPLVWALIGRPSPPLPVRVPTLVSWLLLAATGLVAVRAFDAGLSTDPMAMLPRSEGVRQAAAVLQDVFGLSEARGLVLIEDDDPDRLMDRAARVEEALQRTGIAAPVGAGAVLPGPEVRAERRAALPPLDRLQADIDRIAGEVGFEPFPGAAERIASELDAPVPIDLWAGTVLEERVAAHVVEVDGHHRALVTTPLADPTAEPFLQDTVTGADPQALWLVPSTLAKGSVDQTSQSLLRAAAVGAVALLLLLVVRYRSMERALAALAPAFAAVACASGGLAWVGQPWDLVSVTVMVLVVGLGVDYGIFLADAPDEERRRVASHAIALSTGTTVAGFVPLVFASTPVLRGVGWTLLFGIGGATVVALVLTPRLVSGWPSPRVRAAIARVAWAGLVFVHLDLLLILVTALTPPNLPPLGPELLDRARLVRTEGLWVLSTQGGPVEAGYAAGALTPELRARLEDEMLESFERLVSVAPFRWLITRGAAVVGSGMNGHLREEDQLEIAATAAAQADRLWLGGPHYTRKVDYHAIHDLGQALVDTPLLGCTGFLAGPPVTTGHWLLGRNFDFEGGVAFDRDKVVRVHRPEHGIPYLSVAFAGISGAVTGFNADGIAVAVNASATDALPRPGTPMTLIVREILETASSLYDAQRILEQRTGFVAENVMVVDADAGEAALFEVDSEHVARVPVDGSMAVSNHFRSPVFADDRRNAERMVESTTVHRQQRLEELLARTAGHLDLPHAAEILRDRKGVGDAPLARGHRWALDADLATHGVIIDATDRVAWVSRFPNLAGGYARIALADVLDGKLEATEVIPASQDAETALAVRRGRELLRASRRTSGERAKALADQAAALLPGHPEALFEQGRTRLALGDREGALPLLRAALDATPEYASQRAEIEELLR